MIKSVFDFLSTLFFLMGIYYSGIQRFDTLNDREEIRWNWDNIRIDAKEIATKIKRHSKNCKSNYYLIVRNIKQFNNRMGKKVIN
jgi:hypothetical protein